MEKIKRSFKIFLTFSRYTVKSTLQSKTGVFLYTIAKILRFAIIFLLIFYIVSKAKFLKGYNVNHAIFFFLTYNIIDTVTQFLYREVYRFRWRITTGEFDTVLVKPYHPFLRVLLGGVDILDLIVLIPYIALTIYFGTTLGGISTNNILLYLALITNGIIIATAFHIAVLAFGLITIEVDNALWIYRDITSLGRFPFEIYSPAIRTIFTFAIPIGVMMSFPPRALLGILSPQLVWYSFVVGIIFIIGSLWFWDFAIKKYQSFGG